ncbi:MAG: class I SAM-dependent methyltransferase [Defluviitaleaceae bacterium]|nr:class I SAM-dependent methyltransferase [Defluviitaleaceae bacterium]
MSEIINNDIIKSNLRTYYDREAGYRNSAGKEEWKIKERKAFYDMVAREDKKFLLEIGAGAGYDSQYFMEQGLDVTAIDLSCEMVKVCKARGINAHELDFYNLSTLNKKFDCIWAMNSLLHVTKLDFAEVLTNVYAALHENGLFYMGVYGGEDSEKNWVNELYDTPRFFSFYSEAKLKEAIPDVFEIISFKQYDVGRHVDFQSVIMRKNNVKT